MAFDTKNSAFKDKQTLVFLSGSPASQLEDEFMSLTNTEECTPQMQAVKAAIKAKKEEAQKALNEQAAEAIIELLEANQDFIDAKREELSVARKKVEAHRGSIMTAAVLQAYAEGTGNWIPLASYLEKIPGPLTSSFEANWIPTAEYAKYEAIVKQKMQAKEETRKTTKIKAKRS